MTEPFSKEIVTAAAVDPGQGVIGLHEERFDLAPQRLVAAALSGKEARPRVSRQRPRRVIEVLQPPRAIVIHSLLMRLRSL
jgi:hypothetical protein